MSDMKTAQSLREEYQLYVSMWKDAKVVDGPDSPTALLAQSLVEEVQDELRRLSGHSIAA
ncbi:MAG: hypothetical protein ABI995_10535 [Acidobacteriota bacterium]